LRDCRARDLIDVEDLACAWRRHAGAAAWRPDLIDILTFLGE
jgi:hypothetical protein